MYKREKKKLKRIVSFIMLILVFSMAVMMDFQTSSAAEQNIVTTASVRKRNKKSADEYELSKKKDGIIVKEKKKLSVLNVKKKCNVEFTSSDTNILSVKKTSYNTCEYRGKKAGNVDINVKISKPGFLFMPDTTYLKCRVEVSPRAVSICFTKKKVKLAPGTSRKLKLTTRPSISKEKAVFVSSDSDIAEVDSKGRVTAKLCGTAVITAKISNGRIAKCKVEVSEKQNKKQKN